MNCCQCQGIESVFDRKVAARELEDYRRNGPNKTTRILIEALKTGTIDGLSLLDIGGGVGAIQHALLKAGAGSAVNVDASTSYIRVAKEEAERQGHAGSVTYHHGNFVDLAPQISPADIVTLDRVICCYHDMPALVDVSATKARKFYGLVYPRDTWWMKLAIPILNVGLRLRGNSFRVFVHSTQAVDAILRRNGLQRRFYYRTIFWQVVVYARL